MKGVERESNMVEGYKIYIYIMSLHTHRHTHSATFLKVVLISRESTSKVIMIREVGGALGRQTSDILGEKKRSSQMKRV